MAETTTTGLRVRPASVHGHFVTSGSAKVVSDGVVVVVVTAQARYWFKAVEIVKGVSPAKWSVAVENSDGETDTLTVVANGGCTCGKPWMKKPSDSELLAQAHIKLGV